MPKSAKALGNTPPIQFRLTPDTLAQINELAAALTIPSRAGVVRLAVAQLHRREIGRDSPRKKSGKKSA